MEVWAQLCTIKGVVEDALTGEALIGAYVKSGNAVVATDFDGSIRPMPIPKGDLTLEVSYIGYSNLKPRRSQVRRNGHERPFRPGDADHEGGSGRRQTSSSPKTPVAFTNVFLLRFKKNWRAETCHWC